MEWLGKVSFGNLQADISVAINKVSQSVKTLEKNVDTALGLPPKSDYVHEATDLEVTDARRQTDTHHNAQLQVEDAQISSPEFALESVINASQQKNDHLRVQHEAASLNSLSAECKSDIQTVVYDDFIKPGDGQDQNDINAQTDTELHQISVNGVPNIEPETLDNFSSIIRNSDHLGIVDKSQAIIILSSNIDSPHENSQVIHGLSESSDQVEKLKAQVRMMETTLQPAAKQAQSKADEISRLQNENEKLKGTIENLLRKLKHSPGRESGSKSELNALQEEYQKRLGGLERKFFALRNERDILRREQNNAARLMNQKDETIQQLTAEVRKLSDKQAAQEGRMRNLRAQLRELEEENRGLSFELQVNESKAESLRKHKDAAEKALQEASQRNGADLEFYRKAVDEAKEKAGAAVIEAERKLERRLCEACDREKALVEVVVELRESLSKTERLAASREDMLRAEIVELQKQCHATEMQYEEMMIRLPEATRPLARQMEAMQQASRMRVEGWADVERALKLRLEEAEAKAALAEERERALSDRLSQTSTRTAILKSQLSSLRAHQTQLASSLQQEMQKSSQNHQQYIAALETAAKHEARAKKLSCQMTELSCNLHQQIARREEAEKALLEQEIRGNASVSEQVSRGNDEKITASKNGDHCNFRRRSVVTVKPGLSKVEHLEASVRQKDGELSSYVSRLAALESARDSLADELVKMRNECEKLRGEAASLPALSAELEELTRRHAAALEMIGQRDEELEELRADLADGSSSLVRSQTGMDLSLEPDLIMFELSMGVAMEVTIDLKVMMDDLEDVNTLPTTSMIKNEVAPMCIGLELMSFFHSLLRNLNLSVRGWTR
eukprot:Gb_38479 [translate_table: standard]